MAQLIEDRSLNRVSNSNILNNVARIDIITSNILEPSITYNMEMRGKIPHTKFVLSFRMIN